MRRTTSHKIPDNFWIHLKVYLAVLGERTPCRYGRKVNCEYNGKAKPSQNFIINLDMMPYETYMWYAATTVNLMGLALVNIWTELRINSDPKKSLAPKK